MEEGRKGKEGKGNGKGGEESWYPHFLDKSYAPASLSVNGISRTSFVTTSPRDDVAVLG